MFSKVQLSLAGVIYVFIMKWSADLPVTVKYTVYCKVYCATICLLFTLALAV